MQKVAATQNGNCGMNHQDRAYHMKCPTEYSDKGEVLKGNGCKTKQNNTR